MAGGGETLQRNCVRLIIRWIPTFGSNNDPRNSHMKTETWQPNLIDKARQLMTAFRPPPLPRRNSFPSKGAASAGVRFQCQGKRRAVQPAVHRAALTSKQLGPFHCASWRYRWTCREPARPHPSVRPSSFTRGRFSRYQTISSVLSGTPRRQCSFVRSGQKKR